MRREYQGHHPRVRLGAGFALAVLAIGAQPAPLGADVEPSAEERDADGHGLAEVEGELVELVGVAPELGEPTSYELEAEVVRTMPGTGGDTLRAVQSLPGAARIPFGFGGLVLRGTDPRDTRVYVDDVQVPILYHFGGLASFIPSSMIASLEVMPGGFGPAYGRGQGGLITVRPREARRDRWRAGGHVSLLDASAHVEGPTAAGGLVAGVRRSYIDGILALVTPSHERVLPRYTDAQLRWMQGTPSEGEWTLTALMSEDVITAREEEGSLSFRLGFARAAAGYRRRIGDVQLRALAWLGGDRLSLRDDPAASLPEDEGFEVRRVVAPAGVRAGLVRDFARGHVAAGIDTQGARHGPLLFDSGDGALRARGARWAGDVGLWTEGRYRLDDGLFGLTPGLRLDRFGLTGEWLFAPRLTITHELHPRLTLRESVGLYHQPPNELDLFDDEDQALRSSRAAHIATGADLRLPAAIELRLTGYYLLGDRQAVAVQPPADWERDAPGRSRGGLGPVFQLLLEEQFGSGEYRASHGELRSYGVELGAVHQRGPWFAMLSYTLSRADRTDDPARFVGWRRYELDQPHNLVVMASRRFDRWLLGARLRTTSGLPYTPVIDLTADGRAIYGEPLSARIPPHLQLDVRADYHWEPRWGSGTMKAFFDVQNATHRRNAEGVSHDGTEPRFTRGLPILPIIGLEYTPR
jgi:hypothetical protein